jgi:hypothetical protein
LKDDKEKEKIRKKKKKERTSVFIRSNSDPTRLALPNVGRGFGFEGAKEMRNSNKEYYILFDLRKIAGHFMLFGRKKHCDTIIEPDNWRGVVFY